MPRVVTLLCSRRLPQMAVLALISSVFAGCSADMSTRVSQDPFAGKNPYANPFSSRSEATGPVAAPMADRRELAQYSRPQPYQSQALDSQPLPSQALPSQALPSQALPPAVTTPQSYPVAGGGVSGGGRGLASYAPPSQPKLETTGAVPVPPRSVAAAPVQQRSGSAIQGGPAIQAGATTIIVGTSDTLEIIAQRYHVTPASILAANGYRGPRTLSPGQQLIIPHGTAVATASAALAPASKPVAAAGVARVHIVNPGDTLMSIARHNHVSLAELAKANNLDSSAKLRLGMKLTVPGAKIAGTAPEAPAPLAAGSPAVAAMPASTRVAAAGLQQSARLAQAGPTAEENAAAASPGEATGALPTFRWPVRGKVITSYGAKTNGKSNDGINLAVPEGTPVKAAEDGVVAYSGNELKGYGNLVLVRHSNGYVTAYAHASELLVKRGDPIKRGQVIAKSGQSGEVGSPQLHFEIRKGSSPVDPLQFLNGA
jgi:murein DD-endopeptidase MepM/ murein hydrolase activator NlpD